MLDSEYSMDIYKSAKKIETLMRNPETLKLVHDHLKTKKMVKHALKKLPFQIRDVSDQYKTSEMCDKAIL